ncbi:MAG: hypothetical protein IJA94_02885 [Bacilli bacterium]|nr:hypothetical protein [Bacilli bacterium]
MKSLVEKIKTTLNNFSLGYGQDNIWSGNAKIKFSDEFASLKDSRSYMSQKTITAVGYCITNLESAKKCYDEFNAIYYNVEKLKNEYEMANSYYRSVMSNPDSSVSERNMARSSRDRAQAAYTNKRQEANDKKRELRTFLSNIR